MESSRNDAAWVCEAAFVGGTSEATMACAPKSWNEMTRDDRRAQEMN